MVGFARRLCARHGRLLGPVRLVGLVEDLGGHGDAVCFAAGGDQVGDAAPVDGAAGVLGDLLAAQLVEARLAPAGAEHGAVAHGAAVVAAAQLAGVLAPVPFLGFPALPVSAGAVACDVDLAAR